MEGVEGERETVTSDGEGRGKRYEAVEAEGD